MILPSEELLSAVLGEKLTNIDGFNGISNIYKSSEMVEVSYYETELKCMCGSFTINIYELMHLMKGWALKQYIVHDIDTYCDDMAASIEVVGECKVSGETGCVLHSTIKLNEYEATIDYCEWILKERLK